jgi:homoserine O-acetyltransferase
VTAARRFFQYQGRFDMRRFGCLQDPVIAYESWGTLSAARDNVVLIFTGLSPSAHAASSPEDPAPGWWEEIIGPARPIDTRRYHVVCVNSLGSCFGSTGPADLDPATGQPYRVGFPVLTLEDIAAAGKALLDHLGIGSVHTLVGPSMGGMTALGFAAQWPGFARRLLLISTGARALPFAIALRALQREMIRKDPEWKGGNYAPGEGPVTGMRLARKLGMMTYRSAGEWEQRFGRERIPEKHQTGDPFGEDFEIEAYLESHARKFVAQFDANCYLYLSRAMDLFDLAEHGGSVAAGLARLQAKEARVIGVATDFLFPLHQQRELAEGLRDGGAHVELHELPSMQGHDSFLVDIDRFRVAIGTFFAR